MNEANHSRRKFLGAALTGTAAIGLSSLPSVLKAEADDTEIKADTAAFAASEKLFKERIKGKHKMVFDMWKHSNGAAISWALTLMDTYNEMGLKDSEICVVIVLRYGGGPLALNDSLWAKYEFGKKIELKDPGTNEFALRNLYAKCPTADDDCFGLFQKRGGIVLACKKGMEFSAEKLAEKLNKDKTEMKKEFADNVLPGIHLVPTGIWALNRLQELGCKFCSAG